jgi:hypothetical protein
MAADVEEGAAVASIARLRHIASCDICDREGRKRFRAFRARAHRAWSTRRLVTPECPLPYWAASIEEHYAMTIWWSSFGTRYTK